MADNIILIKVKFHTEPGLKDSHATEASSNFIVGLEGEIVQCVPTWEVAYASNNRNIDTVSIECCHPDESGKFKKET